eukprot:1784693-Karenia_brevis.AAC.1
MVWWRLKVAPWLGFWLIHLTSHQHWNGNSKEQSSMALKEIHATFAQEVARRKDDVEWVDDE